MPFINDMIDNQRRASLTAVEPSVPAVSDTQVSRLGKTRFTFDPAAVMAQLQCQIIGQPQVLAVLAQLLAVVKADIGDPLRPLSVCLFAGPTGVGKTATVQVLAEALTGHRDGYCRIDMNTLAQSHYSAAIAGAPPGYVGSKEGTTLFDEALINGSYSRPGIVLFDEIEKASPEVLRALLNVMEDGQLQLSSGNRVIDFRNSLIFMTSNLGSRELMRWLGRRHWLTGFTGGQKTLPAKVVKAVRARIDQHLDPEFINRLDHLLLFNPLGLKDAPQLVDRVLDKLNERLARRGWRVTLTGEACGFLAQQSFDQRYGARHIRRIVRDQVETPLAQFLLAGATQSDADKPEFRTAQGALYQGRICFIERPARR